MKTIFHVAGALFLLSILSGCASFKERGTWTGEGKIITIYEYDGTTVKALALFIDDNEVKNVALASAVVLIDKKSQLIDPGGFVGRRFKIRGLIYVDNPINPADGKKVRFDPPTKPDSWELVEVIKVNPKRIKFLDLPLK